jgi:hypothetical protein
VTEALLARLPRSYLRRAAGPLTLPRTTLPYAFIEQLFEKQEATAEAVTSFSVKQTNLNSITERPALPYTS